MRLPVAFLLALAGTAAAAETWPVLPDRPGEGRVAFAYTGFEGVDADSLELSLRQPAGASTSFGLDARTTGHEDWAASAVVRRDVSDVIRVDGVSIIAGVGAQETAGDRRATLRLGGRLERGLDREQRVGGWLSLDAEARVRGDTATEIAGSTQLGVTAFERISLSGGIELSGSTEDDEIDTRLSSALVGQVGGRAHVAIGASVGLDDEARTGIHLGTWLEF